VVGLSVEVERKITIYFKQFLFWITLQGTNISHLGKRKIIFKSAFKRGYVSSLEGIVFSSSFLQGILDCNDYS